MATRFLTAEWRYLVMLNYEIAPTVLAPYVPAGTELDAWQGHTFVSLVGFLFLHTRVLGLPVPFHRDFAEVNLRFYVRRPGSPEGARRGVVFIKEIVPKPAIALVARWAYGENYVALRMRHALAGPPGRPADASGGPPARVAYGWRYHGGWNEMDVSPAGQPALPLPGSEEEFITEHYWGYTRRRGGGTLEYQVEHLPWRVWRVSEARLACDVAGLYGTAFAASVTSSPSSAFVADGGPVSVYQGAPLPGAKGRVA
jgi:uncharacterized protein YqjF (DUF2071 family)